MFFIRFCSSYNSCCYKKMFIFMYTNIQRNKVSNNNKNINNNNNIVSVSAQPTAMRISKVICNNIKIKIGKFMIIVKS